MTRSGIFFLAVQKHVFAGRQRPFSHLYAAVLDGPRQASVNRAAAGWALHNRQLPVLSRHMMKQL
jgi:hypothetical protein